MKYSAKKGWVRLHRQIEDNFLYFLQPFTKAQAWIDLFLNANHKDGYIEIRGNVITIKRGQIGWSELTMVVRWKWSKNKVRRFLKLLETEQQIKQQKMAKITTIITILNYDEYQNDTTDDTTERLQTIQQTIHKQECKELKNDNNKIYIAYKEKINSLSRLTDEAKKKIQVRLKTYSEEDLLKAIDNFSKNNWWMEHNSKRGVAWFFHSEDRIDGFMNLEPEKKNEFGYVDKKPYFRGEPMVKKFGKWKVISNGEWKEFAGREDQIEYK